VFRGLLEDDFWDENSQKVIQFMTHVFFYVESWGKLENLLKHLAQTLAKLSKKNLAFLIHQSSGSSKGSPQVIFVTGDGPISLAGWWLSPTPLKNDGVRQLG
jgi:hypothetical protein